MRNCCGQKLLIKSLKNPENVVLNVIKKEETGLFLFVRYPCTLKGSLFGLYMFNII